MTDTSSEIIYWVVFIVYLLFLAVAGFYSKKKTKTLEDYMVAGRKIGPLLLGLSFGVTYFSAVMIVGGGLQSWIWGIGVVWIASIDVLVGVFLVFVLFGNRTKELGKHFESMTVPQLLSKRYNDPKVQTFTSIIILFFETIYLVSIYMGLSILLSVIMPNDPYAYLIAVVLCGIITIIYLNVGGSHGAIYTDAAESMIMLIGVLVIFIAGIIAVGGFEGLLNGLAGIEASAGMPDGGLRTFPGVGGMGLIGYILVTSFGVWGMPQLIARFYTAEKQKSIRWGLVISCVWSFGVAIFAWFNGTISRVYYTITNPSMIANGTVNAENSVPMLMIAVLPPILAGLFLAAVTAASLTTGEKVIMIAASGFSIDVYQKKTGCSDDKALKITKLSTTIIVVVAVILAILKPDAVLALCMFAWSAMAAVILIPYVFGLFWKGGTAKAAIYSGLASFIVAILWKILFRGASLWAMVGASTAYADIMAPISATVISSTDLMTITIGSIHEFIVSQIVAIIAFPLISLLTKDSKPSDEFLKEIFSVMKRKDNVKTEPKL
ncbi:MAG: sodium:solute symporter family transporter [Promethearchaeota archaeon]